MPAGYIQPKVEQEDPSRPAKILMRHSFWAGAAFIVIILVAVCLELFARLLLWVKFIAPDAMLTQIVHYGALTIAVMDVVLLICVLGITSWRFLRSL